MNTLTLRTMELSKAKDIHVGGQAAKELWLGGRMVWAAMPEAIRQSMVLWYDLRRQGATNQSMAADPRLLDLSGNGHHATCQGFAWTEASGVNMTDYPHALVSDGVDDYALTDDIPAFSRETGFTVMAMRENTDPEDTNPAYGIGKSTSSYSDAAFLFDNNPYREGGSRITVFGSGVPVNIDEWKTCKFIALTPEKALAGDTSVAINAANAEDSIRPMCLFITNKNTQYYRKSALYSLLLFDRSLSDDEIAWVRANLMDDGE